MTGGWRLARRGWFAKATALACGKPRLYHAAAMCFRLARIELREIRIPFRFSFKHALAERREAHNLIVAVQADSGPAGYGEIVPRAYLTGESVASAWDDVLQRWWPALRELQFRRGAAPRIALRPLYEQADDERRTASYAGVDIAVHDLWARVTGTPGHSLFGQTPAAQRLTCPLGGGGPAAVRALGRLGRLCRFRDFKLKTGDGDDARRLRAARRALGPAADLRVDANAAWNVERTLALRDVFAECRVSSLEQPIPAGDSAGLAQIQRETGIDVMADESLCTRADARALIQAGAARIWNLRLAKVGGFSGFLELLDLARGAGIRVHHGVLVGETAVLAAAARACAGLADFAHVEHGFGEILLGRQPFRRGPRWRWGVGRPLGPAPGLGVQPVPAVLEAVTIRKQESR
jgi:L-alanine-DL-glutamate epimerase-like enolase superfamily enzyme